VAKIVKFSVLMILALLLVPMVASAVVEEKTETEYPDEITVETKAGSATLKVTGVGLREKTFMKVDVYTIVSYVGEGFTPGEDPGKALRELDAPKRIRMDLRRGFSREKLVNSFTEVIDENYDDTSAFAADLETFLAYFDRDAEEGDEIIFDYCPATGLTTSLNSEVKGIIVNADFATALWTVWFGEDPADDGLKEKLLAAVGS